MSKQSNIDSGSGWVSAPGVEDQELARHLLNEIIRHRSQVEFDPERFKVCTAMQLTFARDGFLSSAERTELLRAMCASSTVELKPQIKTSHRRFVGPVIGALKSAISPFVQAMIGPTFRRQQDFNVATIKLLANLSDDGQKPR